MHVQTYFHQNCPYCDKSVRLVIDLLGRQVACDHCGQRFMAQCESGPTTQENSEPSLLIVESDRERLSDLTRRFAQQGYAVIPVHHPRMALAAASSRNFGVAVVDAELPEMDGAELMRKLLLRVNGLQGVLLTPTDQQDDVHADADDVSGHFVRIDRGCSVDHLREVVEDAIHESRTARHQSLVTSEPPEHLIPR